jgi:hypothetical protein
MALGLLLRLGLRFVLPTTAPALFAVVRVALRLPRAASPFGAPLTLSATRRSIAATAATGLIVAAVLLSATTSFRPRWRLLRLRLSPLPLRFPALLFAAALLFAGRRRAVRPFVAPTPLLFGAFGALLGMAARGPLPTGFRVGGGDRCVAQGKCTADRDRDPLSASVSRAARHVPARLRVPHRARERS